MSGKTAPVLKVHALARNAGLLRQVVNLIGGKICVALDIGSLCESCMRTQTTPGKGIYRPAVDGRQTVRLGGGSVRAQLLRKQRFQEEEKNGGMVKPGRRRGAESRLSSPCGRCDTRENGTR